MESIDLLVSGGEVITAFGRRRADVAVQQGMVVALIDPEAPRPKAEEVVDAYGLYVMPGAIDPHTHIGGGAKVFGTIAAAMQACTRALALGGTTTVMEMIPPTKGLSLSEGLKRALEARQGNMAIDFAFHPSLPSADEQIVTELEKCAEEGIPSFHASFEGARGREPLNEGSLHRLLSLTRERRMMAIIHAEDPRLNEEMIRKIPDSGAIENVSRCRPWFAETAAVRRTLFIAEITRGPLYFEHMGAGPSVDQVRAARRQGLPIYAETCPHYLCFSDEVYSTPRGAEFLKSPPLRRKEDAEALWRGIGDGSISSVATDESVALISDKLRRLQQSPAYHVSGGLNQIELRPAVMYMETVVKRSMPVEKLVQCIATGPAMIFGLYPRKGTIEVGSDADLVLFDPKITKTVRNDDLHQGTDYTIFEGWDVHGAPRMTILRGKVLAKDGVFVGSLSGGAWLPRTIDRAVIEGPVI